MKNKNYFFEGDSSASNTSFDSALKTGSSFISRNKGKFIGGGILLSYIGGIVANWESVKHMYNGVYAGKAMTLWANAKTTVVDNKLVIDNSIWGQIKLFFNNLFGTQGYAAGKAAKEATGWYNRIKSFFDPVFGDGGSLIGKDISHFVVYGVLAVIIALLTWIAVKIIKKIRARKQMAATTESYVSLLSDQSFLEAKQVAYYLKENTAMSKKDCNRIANFVYKKSLNRKLNNLI